MDVSWMSHGCLVRHTNHTGAELPALNTCDFSTRVDEIREAKRQFMASGFTGKLHGPTGFSANIREKGTESPRC